MNYWDLFTTSKIWIHVSISDLEIVSDLIVALNGARWISGDPIDADLVNKVIRNRDLWLWETGTGVVYSSVKPYLTNTNNPAVNYLGIVETLDFIRNSDDCQLCSFNEDEFMELLNE